MDSLSSLAPPTAQPNIVEQAPLDLGSIDSQLQRMTDVEKTWNLGTIPDEVKLDIAMAPEWGSTADELAANLHGLANDYRGSFQPANTTSLQAAGFGTERDPILTNPNIPQAPLPAIEKQSQSDTFRDVYSDVMGAPDAKRLSEGSVESINLRMIAAGIISEDSDITMWDPARNTGFKTLMQQDVTNRFAGNRTGAISAQNAMDLADKWMSPTGLAHAAAQLGIIPDFVGVADSYSKWKDGEQSFWGFAKDFAFDGVLPALNLALMASGVGGAVVFARAGMMAGGYKALKVADTAGDFYRVASQTKGGLSLGQNIANFAKKPITSWSMNTDSVLARAAQISRPSMTSNILQRPSMPGALNKLGSGLAKSRQNNALITARGVTGEVMKMGWLSTLEGELLGDQGIGQSIADLGGGTGRSQKLDINRFKEFRSEHPIVSAVQMPVDIFLAPATVLRDGALANPLKSLGRAGKGGLGGLVSTESKNPLAWLANAKTSAMNANKEHFQQMANVEALSHGHYKATSRALGIMETVPDHMLNQPKFGVVVDSPDKLSQFDTIQNVDDAVANFYAIAAEKGPKEAVKWAYDAADDEMLGRIFQMHVVSTAIDKRANIYAQDIAKKIDDPVKKERAYQDSYFAMKRADSSHLRELRIEDPEDIEVLINVLADAEDMENPMATKIFKELSRRMRSDDPSEVIVATGELIQRMNHHNGLRPGSLNDILHGDGTWGSVSEEEFFKAMQDMGSELFNNKNYMKGDNLLSEAKDLRSRVQLTAEYNDFKNYNLMDSKTATTPGYTPELLMEDSILRTPAADMDKNFYTAFASSKNPASRQVLMKPETVDASQAAEFYVHGKKMVAARKNVEKFLPTVPVVDGPGKFSSMVKTFTGQVDAHGLNSVSDAWIAERAAIGSADTIKEREGLLRTFRMIAANGQDPSKAVSYLDTELEIIKSNRVWKDSQIGRRLDRSGDVESQLDDLKRIIPYLGRRLQFKDPSDPLAAQLKAIGYDLAQIRSGFHGFDVNDLSVGPFAEMTQSMHRKHSMHNFFSPVNNSYITYSREKVFKDVMNRGLRELEANKPGIFLGTDINPDSKYIDDALNALHNYAQKSREAFKETQQLNNGFGNSVTAAVSSLSRPTGMFSMSAANVSKALAHLNLDPPVVKAIQEAAKKANNPGFDVLGIAAIDSWLIANPASTKALKMLGSTSITDEGAASRRVLSAAVGAAGGAYVGQEQGDYDPLERIGLAAAGGIAGAALPAKALKYNTPGTLIGGIVGGEAGADLGEDGSLKSVLGAVGGAALGAGAARAINRVGNKGLQLQPGDEANKVTSYIAHRDWENYGQISEGLLKLRDFFRFSANPMFDARNWVEGATLRLISKYKPEAVKDGLPLIARVKGITKKLGEPFMANARHEWTTLARGSIARTDPSVSVGVDQLLEAGGILGYSVEKESFKAYAYMTSVGVPKEEAFHAARNMFTYPEKGRSALELSANYLVFPFSFQKKIITEMGEWMFSETGRMLLIHDALKMYEFLGSKYDLNEKLAKHVPLAKEIGRLSMWGSGISAGEIGGINRPLINATATAVSMSPANSQTNDLIHLFLPQALQVGSQRDTKKWEKLLKRLLPAWNEIEKLTEYTQEQFYVVSGTLGKPGYGSWGMTTEFEVKQGSAEFDELRTEYNMIADQYGLSNGSKSLLSARLPNGEFKYPEAVDYLEKLGKIEDKYPKWNLQKIETAGWIAETQAKKNLYIRNPQNPTEERLKEFDDYLKSMQDEYKFYYGVNPEADPSDMPVQYQKSARDLAIIYAKEDPEFIQLYNLLYKRVYGPIEDTY